MKRILVLGDSFLDQYLYVVKRKENPEVEGGNVYNVIKEQLFPGGAAAVAMLCASLGEDVTLYSACGIDEAAKNLLNILKSNNVNVNIHYTLNKTIVKTRYLMGSQIYPNRFDYENKTILTDGYYNNLLNQLSDFNTIIISDYGKGFISKYLLEKLNRWDVILVDPEFGRDLGEYYSCSLIKMNEREAKKILDLHSLERKPEEYAATLSDIYDRSVVVTRGEYGLEYAYHNQTATTQDHTNGHVDAIPSDKKDICGAGDTIMAAIGVYLNRGYSLKEACEIAVHYASQQIKSFGIRPLTVIPELEKSNDEQKKDDTETIERWNRRISTS